MEINSVDTLLDWLKVKPRTLGWGAILAYGRSETNKVLMQEYITRFGTGDYMQPITEEIRDTTTPTQKDYLHNYQMDAPRLSFKGASLQKSSAKLTMKEVGGTHLSFTKSVGSQQWSLTRISEKDVLDGPGLKFDIDLVESTGSVTSAGRVELNIAEGSNYRLIDMPSEHLQRVAGERFKTHFRGLPAEQKIFVLNELRFEPDQFLKPSKFLIRTHNKLGAGTRLSANEDEGEGAVLVFVAMEGKANGTAPVDNADLKYLLPEGHSVTVLLGCDIVKENVMAEGLRKVNQKSEFAYRDIILNDIFYGIRGMKGGLKEPWGLVSESLYDIEIPYLELEFYHEEHELLSSHFSFVTPGYYLWQGEEWTIKYCGLAVAGYQLQPVILRKYKGASLNVPGDVHFSYLTSLGFELLIKNGDLVFEKRAEQLGEDYKAGVSSELADYFQTPEASESLTEVFKNKLASAINEAYERFISTLPVLNVFTLNSLLFRGEHSISLESVYTPTDWALFGHVGPTQTAFSITELEPIIPHTVPFQFHTDPPRDDLTWSVRNILGETFPKGNITNRGLYTPPTNAEMPRSSVRVVVTATDGTHTSSALVGITSRSMAINPLIMIATAGDSLAHDVSAGASDGGPLVWSDVLDSGAVVRPNPAEGKDHSYVPGPPIAQSPPTVDTIVVTNPRTQVSETTSVLVLHRAPLLEVAINDAVTLPENQLQLSIMGANGPINPGAWKETWEVLLGGGSAQIDAVTGLLELNPAGPDKFVVITVLAPPEREGGAWDDGFIVLPLPLFSVPETVRMFRADSE